MEVGEDVITLKILLTWSYLLGFQPYIQYWVIFIQCSLISNAFSYALGIWYKLSACFQFYVSLPTAANIAIGYYKIIGANQTAPVWQNDFSRCWVTIYMISSQVSSCVFRIYFQLCIFIRYVVGTQILCCTRTIWYRLIKSVQKIL